MLAPSTENEVQAATPNGPHLAIYRVSFLGIDLPTSHPEAMLTNILLAIFSAALVFAIVQDWQRRSTEGRPPRRPSWLPLGIDRLWLASQAHKNNKGLELWTSMFKNWANPRRPLTFESRLGGNTVIFTIDPENLKAVLARQFSDFGKGGRFQHLSPFLGDSIFINDGEAWSSARQLLRPFVSEEKISDLRLLEDNIQALFLCLEKNSGRIEDVEDLFLRYTLDVITEFLLGISPGSLEEPQAKFAKAFHDIQVGASQIARAGPLAFLVDQKQYRKALQILDEYIEPYVRRATNLNARQISTDEPKMQDSFLHSLSRTTKDPQFLRDSIVTVLFAGRDSTASTITWLLYEMSRHPAVWAKAKEEVIGICGQVESPRFPDLQKMKYVQSCINETLRLYPLVPFNIREALTDTMLPRGGGHSGIEPIVVPKGTAISFSPLLLQRHEFIYEDIRLTHPHFQDPAIFDPSRWEKWSPKAFTFIPFNAGPRLCLGQKFAMTEMVYTVSRLLQRYQGIENTGSEQAPGLMCNLTVSPASKIRIKFK